MENKFKNIKKIPIIYIPNCLIKDSKRIKSGLLISSV